MSVTYPGTYSLAFIEPDFSKKSRGLVAHPEKAPRRARNAKRYKHPKTGKVIETKGGTTRRSRPGKLSMELMWSKAGLNKIAAY